jgi:hypothetical protein
MKSHKFELCSVHQRDNEAFCIECRVYICASCTLSTKNIHKTHSIMNYQETCYYLRSIIDKNIKENYLKRENTEHKILSLKSANLELEKRSCELISAITVSIDSLINLLNKRRNELIDHINHLSTVESQPITEFLQIWKNKEDVRSKIVDLSESKDDNQLFSHADYILAGIEELRCKTNLYLANTFSEVDDNLKAKVIYNEKEKSSGTVDDSISSSVKKTNISFDKSTMQNSRFMQKMSKQNNTESKKIEVILSMSQLEEMIEGMFKLTGFSPIQYRC